jgi:hypothetical protein
LIGPAAPGQTPEHLLHRRPGRRRRRSTRRRSPLRKSQSIRRLQLVGGGRVRVENGNDGRDNDTRTRCTGVYDWKC